MDKAIFRSGYCDGLAVALHEATGLQLGLWVGLSRNPDYDSEFDDPEDEFFEEPSHAVVILDLDEQVWADVDGIGHGTPNLLFTSPVSSVRLKAATTDEVLNAFTMFEDTRDETLRLGREFVSAHPELVKEIQRDAVGASIDTAIKEADVLERMGGYCFAWAVALHEIIPESEIVIFANKPIHDASGRIVGHAAVHVEGVGYFDSEGQTEEANVESWAMLDPDDPEYAEAADMDLSWWAQGPHEQTARLTKKDVPDFIAWVSEEYENLIEYIKNQVGVRIRSVLDKE